MNAKDLAAIVRATAPVIMLVFASCSDPFLPDDQRQWSGVATGGDHTCAITTAGEAYCWGRGSDGQLGNGEIVDAFTPVRVAGDQTFKAITTGDAHSCGLDESGIAYCWGWNAFYQVGSGFAATTRIPVPIDGSARFTAISAGAHHTCAIAEDRRVLCWGYNRWGQNGNGFTQTTIPAEPTSVILDAAAVSAGGYHTCAVTRNGSAYCWGSNYYGQLGIGSDVLFSADPLPVKTDLRFTRIDAGANHTCAIATDGQSYCWGSAEYGELGDGAAFKPGLPGPATPVLVRLISSTSLISAGVNQTCAVERRAGTYCWGRGTEGQLANGDAANFAIRQPIKGDIAFDILSTGGTTHACGISSGILYCWGTGRAGQLGAGANTISHEPQRISR
jgi:alpha-tubulin suppressor-like RCC1 family protein